MKNVQAGHPVAVVVSAMGRKGSPYATDTLIELLEQSGQPISDRELDLMMSCGEIISATQFAHLLTTQGIPASAFTGAQSGFVTDSVAGHANIIAVRPDKILRCLERGRVAVVAGFQGVDESGEIRTLGRGGSDISAVALGAALSAESVQIYSDVDGVAAADPSRLPAVPFLDEISAEAMVRLANEGSRVIHPRAIQASLEAKTTIRARNTFTDSAGTLIHHRVPSWDERPVALAHRDNHVLVALKSESARRIEEQFPFMLSVGRERYLLNDDVYAPQRIAAVQERFGPVEVEAGWTTASVIFEGRASDGPRAIRDSHDLSGASVERITSAAGVMRYLVRAEELDHLLTELWATHFVPTSSATPDRRRPAQDRRWGLVVTPSSLKNSF
jgi:aspartate kinase